MPTPLRFMYSGSTDHREIISAFQHYKSYNLLRWPISSCQKASFWQLIEIFVLKCNFMSWRPYTPNFIKRVIHVSGLDTSLWKQTTAVGKWVFCMCSYNHEFLILRKWPKLYLIWLNSASHNPISCYIQKYQSFPTFLGHPSLIYTWDKKTCQRKGRCQYFKTYTQQ